MSAQSLVRIVDLGRKAPSVTYLVGILGMEKRLVVTEKVKFSLDCI